MSSCQCEPGDPSDIEGVVYFYTCAFCGHAGAHGKSSRFVTQARARQNAAPKKFQFNGTTAWSTPHVSIAGGCHPSQSKGFNEAMKKRGITGAYFNEKGERIEYDRRGRKEANAAQELHDADGMYGD